MREYPKYIIDEADRLCSLAMSKQRIAVTGSPKVHPFKMVVCDLLIESGFKPPVDPLLEEVWQIAIDAIECAHGFRTDRDAFTELLKLAGLTVTVTKAGEE